MIASALALAVSLSGATVFARRGEPPILLRGPESGRTVAWFRLRPDLAVYDNSRRISPWLDSIRYVPAPMGIAKTISVATDNAGTSTWAWCDTAAIPCRWARPFATPEALAQTHPDEVTQVVARADDTYLGYLQELLGTPFVLLPRSIGSGHQTDLRIGSDCAALAAYGRRRMGEKIPYRGPRGLLEHLVVVPPGQMRAGDLLHYGIQVQVVFEDRGRKGYPDGEDLVIQSWHPWPRIVRQDSSGWQNYPYQVMRFTGDTALESAGANF